MLKVIHATTDTNLLLSVHKKTTTVDSENDFAKVLTDLTF